MQPLRAGEGHSFFWRKLHSLSGIVPIGAFLVEHIVSNYEIVNGPLAYAKQVHFLNSLPLVRVLEWAFIFIPLAYHALYGVFIAIRGRSNVNVYPWAGNWMYLSQRITGLIAFLYIIQHVYRQRFTGVSLPEHPGAAFAKVQHELANPWMLAIYVIAMIATTWHFAYGIWLFAAKWGITPGDKRPQEIRLGLRTRRRRPLPHGPHQHLRGRHGTTSTRRRNARAARRDYDVHTACCYTRHDESELNRGRSSKAMLTPGQETAVGLLLGAIWLGVGSLMVMQWQVRNLVAQSFKLRLSPSETEKVIRAHRSAFPISSFRKIAGFELGNFRLCGSDPCSCLIAVT